MPDLQTNRQIEKKKKEKQDTVTFQTKQWFIQYQSTPNI